MDRTRLFRIGFFFSVCLLISSALSAATFDHLNCLSQSEIKKIKSQPSYAKQLYVLCHEELSKKLKALRVTDLQLRLIFASTLAYANAPYGASNAITLQKMLAEKTLNCGNYVLLAGYLAKIIAPTEGTYELHFIGFDGGAVGNHAQLIMKDGKESLLLDPTIGLVAKVSFNDLLSGKPIAANKIHVFRQHNDKVINAFAEKVAKSVRNGNYRPSDLLYYFYSMEDSLAFANITSSAWGGDLKLLSLRYPTPAAKALKENLTNQRAKKQREAGL